MKKRKKPHNKSCRRDQALSFHTSRHLCRQGGALAGTRQLHSQGPMSVHAHRTKRVTGSEEREGANGVGGGIRVGGGNGDVNVDEDGDGAGTRTGWGSTKDRKMGTGTEAGAGTRWGRERGRG